MILPVDWTRAYVVIELLHSGQPPSEANLTRILSYRPLSTLGGGRTKTGLPLVQINDPEGKLLLFNSSQKAERRYTLSEADAFNPKVKTEYQSTGSRPQDLLPYKPQSTYVTFDTGNTLVTKY